MLVVHTTVPVDPAHREEALELVEALAEHSRTEDGTVRYRAGTDLSDPNVVRFFEQYEDAAAAEAHAGSEPYRRFVEALPAFADGEIETVQFKAEDVQSVSFGAEAAVEALD